MSPGEAARLRRLPHLAVALYAVGLRPRADAGGWVRGVTWRELAAELSVPARGREAAVAPYRQQLQRALAVLVDAGLVDGASDGFEFAARCILVDNVRDNVRAKASCDAGFETSSVRDNVRDSTLPENDNVRDNRNGDGDLGYGSVRGAAVVDSGHGSPLPPSPFSPLRNPPISPSTLPPSASSARTQIASAEVEKPEVAHETAKTGDLRNFADSAAEPEAFALTAPPSEDQMPPQRVLPLPEKHRIADTWVPTSATLKTLEQKGVAPSVALAERGHFIAWWQDRTQREGSKRASGWQLAFINWCLKLAPRKKAPSQGPEVTTGVQDYAGRSNQQQPRQSASERNRHATRQHFARRNDFPDK